MGPPEYRIPPTHPVYPSGGYESTQPAPPMYYDIPPIPPPPPPGPRIQRHAWSMVGFIVLLLCLVSVGIFAEWVGIQPKTNKRIAPTTLVTPPTPTMDPNYTAKDIYQDMEKDGCSCGAEMMHDVTIQSYAGQDYFISMQATSSLSWSDPVQQFDNIGLWVYADTDTALSAFSQVGGINGESGSSAPVLKPTEYLHSRCLLLVIDDGHQGASPPWSGYKQAIDKYCV